VSPRPGVARPLPPAPDWRAAMVARRAVCAAVVGPGPLRGATMAWRRVLSSCPQLGAAVARPDSLRGARCGPVRAAQSVPFAARPWRGTIPPPLVPPGPARPWRSVWPSAAHGGLAQAQLAAAWRPRRGPIMRAASWHGSSCSRCGLRSVFSCPGMACMRIGSAATVRPPAQPCAASLSATCLGVDPSVTARRVRRTARSWLPERAFIAFTSVHVRVTHC
jgi:hypothetical protein